MRMNRRFLQAAALGAAFLLVQAASGFAQGTPWIAEPRSGSVTISYGHQAATEFWRADNKGPTPGNGAELSQTTGWLDFNYALTDAVAVDVRSGFGRSHIPGPVGPTPQESFSGLVDTNVSLTWRILDELVTNGAPSIAIRAGVIAAGGYETGHINSLGDGGNGAEASVIVGRFVDRVGFSGELGYRLRSGEIPADTFANLAAFLALTDRISVAADYRMVNGDDSGLDIGGPGFAPDRFPELQEDAQLLGGRLLVTLNDSFSLNGFYGQVVSGRNTAASSVFGAGVTYTFITN